MIIVGAGFGGLFVARYLAGKKVEVLLIDKNNFHTFTPLLYQVATCALDPSEIAYPVRSIFRENRNVRFLLGEVTGIDTIEQTVTIRMGEDEFQEGYDYLVLAAGSAPKYFGDTNFEQFTFELHTLGDAIELRNHVLRLFERAVWTEDNQEREALLTIVVVGGGPTGIETAGAIHELYNHVLEQEFTQQELNTRVILVELLPHLLSAYPEKLRASAKQQLESLGVEVILSKSVAEVAETQVQLNDGTVIPTCTVLWAAGVKASPVGKLFGVDLVAGDRLPVLETMQIIGVENVYAVGDMTFLKDPHGNPYPMLIPVAQQQAILAAKNILADIHGEPQDRFHYKDKGIMATIGRRRAVAWLYNRIQLSGFLAWLVWLVFHLLTLLGFRNRLNVLVNWIWNYFTFDRSVRIILEQAKGR